MSFPRRQYLWEFQPAVNQSQSGIGLQCFPLFSFLSLDSNQNIGPFNFPNTGTQNRRICCIIYLRDISQSRQFQDLTSPLSSVFCLLPSVLCFPSSVMRVSPTPRNRPLSLMSTLLKVWTVLLAAKSTLFTGTSSVLYHTSESVIHQLFNATNQCHHHFLPEH